MDSRRGRFGRGFNRRFSRRFSGRFWEWEHRRSHLGGETLSLPEVPGVPWVLFLDRLFVAVSHSSCHPAPFSAFASCCVRLL